MNDSRLRTLSVVAVIAASLLGVGIVAALSMIEQADALTNTQSATSSASGGNGGNGANGANGANGGNGGNAQAIISQFCGNFCPP